MISVLSPQQPQSDACAVISGSYKQDGASSIDASAVTLLMDGSDVSDHAEIGTNGINYRPSRLP